MQITIEQIKSGEAAKLIGEVGKKQKRIYAEARGGAPFRALIMLHDYLIKKALDCENGTVKIAEEEKCSG